MPTTPRAASNKLGFIPRIVVAPGLVDRLDPESDILDGAPLVRQPPPSTKRRPFREAFSPRTGTSEHGPSDQGSTSAMRLPRVNRRRASLQSRPTHRPAGDRDGAQPVPR